MNSVWKNSLIKLTLQITELLSYWQDFFQRKPKSVNKCVHIPSLSFQISMCHTGQDCRLFNSLHCRQMQSLAMWIVSIQYSEQNGFDWSHRLLNLEFGQVSKYEVKWLVIKGSGWKWGAFYCFKLNQEPWRIWSWFPTQGRQNSLDFLHKCK